MNIYEETLKEMKDFKSYKSHLTSLGKIFNKTEDKLLKKELQPVIRLLTEFTTKTKDSTPRSLAHNTTHQVTNLIKHLTNMIPRKQPEWQIIALREGWSPPKG